MTQTISTTITSLVALNSAADNPTTITAAGSPKPPCAPMLTDDPDLHLLADGDPVGAAARTEDVHIFQLPGGLANVRVVSRAGVPQEMGLARDPRCLGVALRRIVVRQGSRFRIMEAADKRLTDGFHGFERAIGLRWTNGDATLPAALFEGFNGAVELVLHLGGSARYRASAETLGVRSQRLVPEHWMNRPTQSTGRAFSA
jgi:hypothetical protein